MLHLLAASSQPGWSGGVGRAEFETLAEAESVMRDWARFGVDAYCNDPDTIWIADDEGRVLKVWDWRQKQPVDPPPEERQT